MELESINYLKFLFALLFVIGLIGGFGLLAKKMGLGNRGPIVRGTSKRLSIVETMALDPKRRVVLIQCDDNQHLLLLGTNSEHTIDTNVNKGMDAHSNIQPQHLSLMDQSQKRAG